MQHPFAKRAHGYKQYETGYDDENHHYNPMRGEILNGKYRVEDFLGKGTFGRVVSCKDVTNGNKVAVKIIRAIPKYTRAGQIEIQILQQIRKNSHISGSSNVLLVMEHFVYRDHVCIVFPLYGSSLLDLLRFNKYRGFNLDWTRELGRSFLSGVSCMHAQRLIHTDLKPENILSIEQVQETRVRDRTFVHPPSADMVVIDLGSTISDHDRRPSLVCTRQYRPPEVILELPWGRAIDIWSCGCILYELFTGRTLFRTHNSSVHLAMMSRILGPMPEKMANPRCALSAYYRAGGAWECPRDVPEDEIRHYNACTPLKDDLFPRSRTFYDLVRQMLAWDPDKRPSIAEVFQHPFFFEEPRETRLVQTDVSLLGEPADRAAHDLKAENLKLRRELEALRANYKQLQAELSRMTGEASGWL
eukprot:gnl/Chilomastix_cuspidata/1670.p2 GENE.gnl/Chilomastix_cuspidata/1670~~gnl/Chilomastix_cuspidata/1670.p2  ORF type:complete len:416 (-),score=204.73 gnl/Chilomastix_cuspidata/1670:86-1333(-)